MEQGLSSTEVMARTGLTYRRLDYLSRRGVVMPRVATADGPGSARRWAADQIPILRMVTVLLDHGAEVPVAKAAAAEIERFDDDVWDARVLVTRDGRIVPPVGSDPFGWLIDLRRCRDDTRIAA